MGSFNGKNLVALGLIGIGVVVGVMAGARDAPSVAGVTPPHNESVSQPNDLIPVHVSGWVVSPGIVWVEDGSLVATVIEAASGAREGARLDLLNLAQNVGEGDHLVVPGPDSAAGETDPATGGDGLIDINKAGEEELQALPGVGPVLAARIVAHRESVGGFEAIEDLLDVPGIGETRLASIRDLIRPP